MREEITSEGKKSIYMHKIHCLFQNYMVRGNLRGLASGPIIHILIDPAPPRQDGGPSITMLM